MPALRQIERSWDSLDPQDWTEFLWDDEADRLLSPPTDALEYLELLFLWKSRFPGEGEIADDAEVLKIIRLALDGRTSAAAEVGGLT